MRYDSWIPPVLRDLENYCAQHDIPEFAERFRDLRRDFIHYEQSICSQDSQPSKPTLRLVVSR